MANFNSAYSGETDFLEWYKKNYGVDYDGVSPFSRKEGMSDVDWEIGSSLYDSYRQGLQRKSEYDSSVSDIERAYGNQVDIAKTNRDYSIGEANKRAESSLSQLEEFYKSTGEALDKSKRQSQQNASITLDKLKKYLPTQIKAQGLGGLGVSESTLLKAYNNYNSDMGAIESDYQQNKTALETNYQDNKRSVESERDSAISSANNTFDNTEASYGQSKAQALSDLEKAYNSDNQRAWESAKENATGIFDRYKQKYEEAQKEEREAAYITATSFMDELIGDGNYDEALRYLEANKDVLGEMNYNSYKSRLEGLVSKQKEETTKKEQEETDTRVLEGKEYVVYNGKQYKLISQLSQDANEIKRNNDFKSQLEKIGFTNPYDSRIPNGTTLTIKADNKGANDFNFWDDVGAFLLSPLGHGAWDSWANWNTVNVTYYNGNWYKSEDKGSAPQQTSTSSTTPKYTQPVVDGFKLPDRATTDETNKAYQAIKNNDYETFKRYMPSSYSETSMRAYYEKYGGK